MVQLGMNNDPTEEYETSYMEVQYLIDQHIFRGEEGEQVEPVVVAENALPGIDDTQATNEYVGSYVTLKGLTYANEIFTLLYINSAGMDTDLSQNRVFLSVDDGEEPTNFGITTWAMSEQNVKRHLEAGDWDDVLVGNANDQNYGTVADHKDEMMLHASPGNVSQYFTMPGGTEVQVRTSGYSRFADLEIDPEVLAGNATIDVTGVLTMYQGSIQFVVLDQNGIHVNE